MALADAAYDVLRGSSDTRPLSNRQIAEIALKRRLVRGELEFPEYGQIFAHCRVDRGPWHLVPFTLLAPVS